MAVLGARNFGGPFDFIVEAESDLATIVNPKIAQTALALAEGSLWFHTGVVWQQVGSNTPINADYLVGTSNSSLTNEIVVGATPGGELGNTWASPTVDATHSGTSHAGAASAETADIRSADVLVGTATSAFSGEIVAGTAPGGELGGTWASPTVDATHSGSAHHTQAHDATDHTDITRTFFFYTVNTNVVGVGDNATSVTNGTVPDRIAIIQLADGATQGFSFVVQMPSDAKAASPLLISPIWAGSATDATPHTVRWSADCLAMPAGIANNATGTTVTWTGDSSARTASLTVYETATQVLASVNAGECIRVHFRRIGADAADTYVGNVWLTGLQFNYTAVQ